MLRYIINRLYVTQGVVVQEKFALWVAQTVKDKRGINYRPLSWNTVVIIANCAIKTVKQLSVARRSTIGLSNNSITKKAVKRWGSKSAEPNLDISKFEQGNKVWDVESHGKSTILEQN
jgi:hypothetical protein